MKVTNCYYCGSDKHTFYAEENGFSLVKCDACGLLFIEDRPSDSDISEATKQGVHHGVEELDVTGLFSSGRVHQYGKILKDLFGPEIGRGKTWLDVGCGQGELLIAVTKYSHGTVNIKGTEPNVHKQESARKRGLNVTFIQLDGHEEKYDIVSLLNVYSHLPDPPEFLNTLKGLLKPGGELILQTGDTADLPAKDHFRPFYLPNHLSFASEKIVRGILERLDFEIVRIKKYPLIQLDLNNIAREIGKAILPGYKSKFRYLMKWKTHSKYDMFVRARLKR